jgi:cytochrome c oxidase cbb3-type subunit 3/ubiquinol-cytochrome c reductase cytochrome c subunit
MRNKRAFSMTGILCIAALLQGCNAPGKPKPGPEVPRPESVMSFDQLYGQNCAGCHGVDGQNGPATNLQNPEYEAFVDDATLLDVTARGRKGSLMPGFAVSAGGNLSDTQVRAIVQGMRSRWFKGNVLAGANPPAYKAAGPGNTANGQVVYVKACARCHGNDAAHPGPAGSVLDGALLGLINEQTIRTTIVPGRPDIGQPDWRNMIPERPLTDAEVTDVASWMIAQRPVNPGQPYPAGPPSSPRPGEAQPKAESRPKP